MLYSLVFQDSDFGYSLTDLGKVPFAQFFSVALSLSLLLAPFPVLRLPWWLSGKESACHAGTTGEAASIPGMGRSLGGGNGNKLQYSCLENSTDRIAWSATVHRVIKSQTQLKRKNTQAHVDLRRYYSSSINNYVTWRMEEGMTAQSSILAWRTPRTEEPGGLRP